MAKTLTQEQILQSLPNQSIEALLNISKETAQLIEKQEKEAEEKLNLIRKGGNNG